jgi:hypothetical protein
MYRQQLQVIARESHFPIVSYGADHFVLTPQIIAELREKTYLEQWQTAVENGWFHLKMQDHSLFLFTEGAMASYSFLHCPLEIVPFVEFLDQIGERNTPASRRKHFDDYNKVVETASERRNVTPIRFDYDPVGYRPGVHPVAHIHIGISNEIRLCSNRMNAVSFVLFVMRHMYPRSWEKLLSRENVSQFVRAIRSPSTKLLPQFWGQLDAVELHFK